MNIVENCTKYSARAPRFCIHCKNVLRDIDSAECNNDSANSMELLPLEVLIVQSQGLAVSVMFCFVL
ncbi:hypothetical protein LENED_008695 [Lentinula edodes]|uniref:Uncharacterized protein n=1 Tax=Lentinula edodes TaxID=5353 RepID=A0A1Q3EHW5_LENED|nr:hypothetical protein LENED_008695 [Lentinula edodes]